MKNGRTQTPEIARTRLTRAGSRLLGKCAFEPSTPLFQHTIYYCIVCCMFVCCGRVVVCVVCVCIYLCSICSSMCGLV